MHRCSRYPLFRVKRACMSARCLSGLSQRAGPATYVITPPGRSRLAMDPGFRIQLTVSIIHESMTNTEEWTTNVRNHHYGTFQFACTLIPSFSDASRSTPSGFDVVPRLFSFRPKDK
jgi:hypothetical protein